MTDGSSGSVGDLEHRHSVRAFRPEPVPSATLDRLLEAAQRAPSWCNTQPWRFLLLDPITTAGLADSIAAAERQRSTESWDIAPPPRYRGDHRQRRFESGMQLYAALGIDRQDRAARAAQFAENYRFFGAPHVGILTADSELGSYAYVDTGVYLGSLLLAAHSLGLGAVAQGAISAYSDVVHQEVGIPADRHVVCAVAIGYEDESQPVNAFRTSRVTTRPR